MDMKVYQRVQQAVDKAMLEELEELTLAEECQIIFDLYMEQANITELSQADKDAIRDCISRHSRV